MKRRFDQIDHFQFIIADTNAFGVEVCIQFGADGQPILGRGASDEVDDDFMADYSPVAK